MPHPIECFAEGYLPLDITLTFSHSFVHGYSVPIIHQIIRLPFLIPPVYLTPPVVRSAVLVLQISWPLCPDWNLPTYHFFNLYLMILHLINVPWCKSLVSFNSGIITKRSPIINLLKFQLTPLPWVLMFSIRYSSPSFSLFTFYHLRRAYKPIARLR